MGESFKSKMKLYEANALAEQLTLDLMRAGMTRVEVCGSVRRQKPEVGDLDIVVAGDITQLKLPEHAHRWRYADGGIHKCTLEYDGRQVNILRADESPEYGNWGAAILYFTGSSTFNLIMRRKAKKRGLKLNEYGLWTVPPYNGWLAGTTEEGIFTALEMAFVPPTSRSK